MASEGSNFDLQTLLADAQDLVDESFVARALLQPETNPWESFPFSLLYPTEDPFNEIHYSLLCDPPADSLPATEVNIKTEPAEDTPLFQSVSETLNEHERTDHLWLTEQLEYPNANSNPSAVASSSSPTENAPFTQPDIYLSVTEQLEDSVLHASPTATISHIEDVDAPQGSDLFPLSNLNGFIDQLDYLDTTPSDPTPAIAESNSFSATTASPPTTIVSPNSPFATISSSSSSELTSSGAPDVDTEDVPYSTLNYPDDGASAEPVHYTFVDPHEKPRKRRTKGIKNSTPIACTFCRQRKIRCGGPQEGGGVCKSCIRLNHKGECVFPAVSYRGQRLGGSNPSSKRKSTSKGALPPSESS